MHPKPQIWLILVASLIGSGIEKQTAGHFCEGPSWSDYFKREDPQVCQLLLGSAYIWCCCFVVVVCLFGKEEKKLGFCLFAFTLAGQFIYSASASDDCFMDIKANFFGFPCGLRKTAPQ